jgi:hypothetical protein
MDIVMNEICPRCNVGVFNKKKKPNPNDRGWKYIECSNCECVKGITYIKDVWIFYFFQRCNFSCEDAFCSHSFYVGWELIDRSTHINFFNEVKIIDMFLPFDVSEDRMKKILLLV